jgi:hypothetical protein
MKLATSLGINTAVCGMRDVRIYLGIGTRRTTCVSSAEVERSGAVVLLLGSSVLSESDVVAIAAPRRFHSGREYDLVTTLGPLPDGYSGIRTHSLSKRTIRPSFSVDAEDSEPLNDSTSTNDVVDEEAAMGTKTKGGEEKGRREEGREETKSRTSDHL